MNPKVGFGKWPVLQSQPQYIDTHFEINLLY